MSDLVGHHGRVIAIEPVPDTFTLLAANVALFQYSNVTLLNVAASDRTVMVAISIPAFPTGLKNYNRAAITAGDSGRQAMTVALDSLSLTHRISLAKIDAEGPDPAVLVGMERILARDHPTLIVETSSPSAVQTLTQLGYRGERLPGSSNELYRWFPESPS